MFLKPSKVTFTWKVYYCFSRRFKNETLLTNVFSKTAKKIYTDYSKRTKSSVIEVTKMNLIIH